MKNEFVSVGRVINLREIDSSRQMMTLFVNDTKERHIRIVCENSLCEKLQYREYIEVRGYVSGSEKGVTNHVINHQLYATSVKPATTIMEKFFQIKGNPYYNPKFELAIEGNLKTVVIDERFTRFWLEIEVENGKHIIQLDCETSKLKGSFEKGDHVYVVCRVHTPRKNVHDQITNFENLIILDIIKAP